jgi:membrane protein
MAGQRGRLWRVGAEIVRRLNEHNFMMMAAAIAFFWLLTLIPLLLLGSSAVGYFLGSSDEAADAVMTAARRLIPQATGPEVEQFLGTVIKSRHVAGLLGIGFLLWLALEAFDVIISSLTALTGERESRSFLRRKFIALVLVCTAGFLLMVALMGGWVLAAWPNIETLLGFEVVLPAFLAAPGFPRDVATALMAILLTIVYLIAPVRQIRWPAAVAGASIATACWYGARRFLNWFVRHYLSTSLLFGILGGVIVLILWIFYTAIVLLLGGILADVFDGNRAPQKGRPSPLPHPPSETRREAPASLPRES